MKSVKSNHKLSSQHKSNLQVLGKHSGQGCDVWGTTVDRPSWPDGCQVARLPQANTQFLPTILLPLIPREVSDMQRAKSFRSSRAQITYSMSTLWSTVELLEMQKEAQSLRALPFWFAREVSCKGSSSDISSSQYFLLWISAQWKTDAWMHLFHWIELRPVTGREQIWGAEDVHGVTKNVLVEQNHNQNWVLLD